MLQRLTSLISAVVVFAWAPVASAQIWSAPGVTGSIDEADTSMYVFGSNGAVAIKSSVARGTLNVRFPVQTVPDLLVPQQGDCPDMRAVLRDTGPGARVIIRLMRLGVNNGFEGQLTSLGEIDSDMLQSGGDPNQYRRHSACLNAPPDSTVLFDFCSFTYFVDVQLIKTTATASPGLMAVQICPAQDACDS